MGRCPEQMVNPITLSIIHARDRQVVASLMRSITRPFHCINFSKAPAIRNASHGSIPEKPFSVSKTSTCSRSVFNTTFNGSSVPPGQNSLHEHCTDLRRAGFRPKDNQQLSLSPGTTRVCQEPELWKQLNSKMTNIALKLQEAIIVSAWAWFSRPAPPFVARDCSGELRENTCAFARRVSSRLRNHSPSKPLRSATLRLRVVHEGVQRTWRAREYWFHNYHERS